MSFTTFKSMHTFQRVPQYISILVFTSEMAWFGVFVDRYSQLNPCSVPCKVYYSHALTIYCDQYLFLHLGVHD